MLLCLVHFSCHFQYALNGRTSKRQYISLQNICIIYFLSHPKVGDETGCLKLRNVKCYPCIARPKFVCFVEEKLSDLTRKKMKIVLRTEENLSLRGSFSKSQRFNEPSGVAWEKKTKPSSQQQSIEIHQGPIFLLLSSRKNQKT